MNVNKLIFHFGGPKTGSSALQTFLSANKDKIGQDNIHYRESSYSVGEINSGNGYDLYTLLKSRSCTAGTLDQMVSSYLSQDGSTAICSSELFAFLELKEIHQLLASCERLAIDYSVLFFVRSPLEYCVSNHNQLVKRHGECRSLEEYLSVATWDHYTALRRLDEVVPQNRMLVKYYDAAAAANIVKTFFEAVSLPVHSCSLEHPQKINRSFSSTELDLMMALNKILGASYSQTLSDIILKSGVQPAGPTVPAVSGAAAQLLNDRFAQEAEWINSVFLARENARIETVLPSMQPGADTTPAPQPAPATIEKNLLLWAANELANVENRFFDQSRAAISHLLADTSMANDPAIPPDFNPVAYLVLNPDLIKNSVNPYFHFIHFAKKENRKYVM